MNRKVIFIFSALSLFISMNVIAQTGATCATPDVITALPYTATGLTTNGAGNDYDGTACSSDYLSGEDYVFTYTPAANLTVDIILSNTGYGTGLFVMDGCPDMTPNCIDYAEGLTSSPSISALPLTSGTTYYIIVSTYDFMSTNPNTDFDIEINELIQNDAGVVDILAPVNGCGLSNTESVTITVHNFGLLPMSNFGVSFQVDGGTPVTETITATVEPDSSYTYTFTGTADLSTPSTYYEIKAYTGLTGDGDSNNDTTIVTVANQPSISTFPYSEDFESGSGWWSTTGANSSWELGTPAASVINSAASGNNSWVTNLTGNHASNEISQLISPCFDFSSLTKPRIEFSIWYETTMILGNATLLYTIDNGNNWDTLKAGTATDNWYIYGGLWTGSSAGWLTAYNTVPLLAGQSSVQFKFEFAGGLIASEGLAIDDILIEDCSAADPIAGFSYSINGSAVSFTNSSTGATSYYWDFDEIMATSTDENPSHTYLLPGSYNVTLIAMNECGSDTIEQTVDIVTGISGTTSQNIRVFPNPAKDHIYVEGIDLTNATYEIYDMNGKQYLSENAMNNLINIKNLKNGLYIVKIVSKENTHVIRIAIQK